MKALFAIAALLAAAPLAAQQTPGQAETPIIYLSKTGEVLVAVRGFFDALRSEDKSALAKHMIPGAVIFVHNQMDPDNPRIVILKVEDHLARWAQSTRSVNEVMWYDDVQISESLAHVYGPYTFWVEDKISHCGVNSLSLVKQDGTWKIGNSSFTMVSPDECATRDVPKDPKARP
jgi:hypothetical protein